MNRRHILRLLLVVIIIATTPLLWRGALTVGGPPAIDAPPSYLPALEATRERRPFDPVPIEELRSMQPSYVIVSDSMGGRIDAATLTRLTDQFVAPLLRNATGPAYWYLMFKNYVIGSGIKPKWTFFFFRDTVLTDTTFRLLDSSRRGVDEVALDVEPELNAIVAARTHNPWFALHRAVDRAYDTERARAWIEPAISGRLSGAVAGSRGRTKLLDGMNSAFSLEHLRPITAADMEAAADRTADFDANVKTSVLPLILQLAREHDLKLCFVRVLRRPVDGRPPAETPRLQRYVADMRRYLEANGAMFRDDTHDADMLAIPYGDGDHIGRGQAPHYTELFYAKLAALFR